MSADQDPSPPAKSSRLLKSALMLVGTMAFGGLAVALWNRRELTRMHSAPAQPPPPPLDEEIF
jgi:hypothetical protein